MKDAVKKSGMLARIWKEKCPNCGGSDVYQNIGFFKMPLMKDKCEKCNYTFDREPGYFLGAMYISYGIAVFAGLLTFLLLYMFAPTLPTIYFPLAIVFVILIIARKNYKLSRIIYMHLFPW